MSLIGGTGPVMHLIGMPGFLETYKIDCTFRMQSPDNIDPGRTKSNVPWSWQISDDVGAANPIVARVFIQSAEALNNKHLRRGDAEKIKIALHTCKGDLRNCEKAFSRLAGEYDKIVNQIRDAGGLRVEKRVINNLPQISDLDHDATIFLTSAKRGLQSIAEVLNEFYGVTIANARFDKGRTQLEAQNPVPREAIAVLDLFKPTIERVLHLRNFQEHTPRKTIIENFRPTASEILPPKWRVDPELAVDMLPEMVEILGAIIAFAEQSFFHGLMDCLDAPKGPFAYCIEEIPENQRQGTAIRYRCELRFGK